VCVCACVCVCVCGVSGERQSVKEKYAARVGRENTVHMCLCLCQCRCEGQVSRQGGHVYFRVCSCVCVCGSVCVHLNWRETLQEWKAKTQY
jgi:hypothetical protein